MTEEQIERLVESMTDSLDKIYLSSDMSETEYKRRLKEIDDWAEKELNNISK